MEDGILAVVGEDGKFGLCIRWIADGLIVELAKKKVDSLRIQYEHEVASLQRQLEAERRCEEEQLAQRHEEYSQAVSELRAKLDIELHDSLDQIIEELSQLHSQEMKQLLATHQDDLSIEITALKISLEQIYTTKAQLEASQQQEIFQQKLEAVERRHKEELNKVKHGIILPEALEHLSETLTDDYNKLIQRISHELEMRFVNDAGDSGFGSQASQELHSLLISQQEEITMLRSKLLAEYGSLIHSRLDMMTEHAEEVNRLEDQMNDIKVQCDQQMEHLQESIKSHKEFELKESKEQDTKLQGNVDEMKKHYKMVIEKMESEFEAKISALQDKYEDQMSALCLAKIPLTAGVHSDLVSTNVNSRLISSRDNSVESGSFSESVEKDMSDQMKKLEAELLERDTFQQKLRNDLVNEELRRKALEAEVSQLKEALEKLKAEYECTISRCSSLESLVKEREDRIIQLEYEKMESEKLYRDLLDKESKVSGTIEPSNIEDSVEFTSHNLVASTGGNNNYSPSDSKEMVERLESLIEDLEHQLAAAKSKEHDLRDQMEEKEHTFKEMLESLKSELDHEKKFEIETLQSEFKVQLAIELKHQAAELTSRWSDADHKEHSLACAVFIPSPVDVLPSSHQDIHLCNVDSNLTAGSDIHDQDYQAQIDELKQQLEVLEKEKTAQVSGYKEELENLREQLNESEDRYDRLMQGIESGELDQLNEMFQDKYDRQLELVKSLMQKDFDEMLHNEKKSLVEKHRKLMIDLMGDRSEEEKTMQENHQVELEQLKQSLSDHFQKEREKYTLEISRLSLELEEVKKFTQSTTSDHRDNKNLMLPEIDEIVLSFQEITENTSSSLEGSRGETSTPVKLNDSDDSSCLVQMIEEHHFCADNLMTDIPVKTYAEALKSPLPLSACERKKMTEKIEQLSSQVENLTLQLADLQRLPLSENSLTCSTDTIKGDDSALLAMLKSDLDRISIERESIQRTNDRLLSLLSDSVKTYIGVEDTISRRLSHNVFSSLYSAPDGASASAHSPRPGTAGTSQSRESSPDTYRVEKRGDADTSQDSYSVENTSFQSNGIDEGLEISQRLAECIFVGPDLDAEGEEILSDARSRLQTSISQLLELMERSCLQLQEAKSTQNDLLEALSARAREMESLNNKCQELNSQISSEIEAKEYLGLELHKAEGLIAGYISEHDSLESQIQTLEHQRESLILELDTTRSRLEHFEQSQSELDSFRDELNHQQQVLQENAGQEIQVDESNCMQATEDSSPALLGEITSLNKDKRELANQLQQQLDLTRKRLLELETQSEESERYHDAALEQKFHEIEDLKLQLENVERQLKSSKAFVDDQLLEREQEREEHQKEIEKLQEMLEAKDRQFNSQQRLQFEISDLNEQLQTRMNSQSAMHQHILDLQKSLQDKELSAHDLKVWVAQLEKELDQRGDVEEQLKQRISRLEQQLTNKKDDSIIDSAESSLRDSMKERTPPLILSPLQTQKVSSVSLEGELRRCQQFEQELVHENKALKEQVQVQLLQISGLRNQLDELRQYSGMEADTDSSQLRIKLQASRDALEKLEEKLSESQSKIESLENTLRLKTEESDQIRLKVSRILDMGNAVEENEHLKNQLEDLQNQISHLSSISSLSSLPPELLEEKNSEIHEMQEKLTKLEKNLTDAQEESALHKEKVLELQARLKEKDEEISDLQDNIASLRRGEPFLDMSLPMNEDANNFLNISMTGRMSKNGKDNGSTSMQQEFEETILNKEAELSSLNEKITQITKDLEKKNQDIANLEDTVFKLKAEKEQHAGLEEAIEQRDSEIYSLTLNTEEMKQQIQEQVESIELLEHELEKWEKKLSDVVEERDKYHSEVTEKDYRLDQMQIQIENCQHEITSLTNFQHELQKDFDTVQSMLDEKEKEVEALVKELTENKSQSETLEALLHLEGVVAALKKELAQKHNVIEEKEEELYELRDKLEEMVETKTEEMASLKQQMTETEEQLRLRQTVVLDLEAEKDKLLLSLEDSKHLQKRLEEKDLIIEELESQLRFRQSRILDMESEKDKLVEEKEALEMNLVQKLTDKDAEIEKLESFNQHRAFTDVMEQTSFSIAEELSNACVNEGPKMNSTLIDETLTVKQMEEELYTTNLKLLDRDKQIQMLQEEVETLHQDSNTSFQLHRQVKELQDLLQDKEESSEAQAIEYQTVITRLEKEIADLKSAFGDNQRQESRVISRSAHVSLSSSMDDESPGLLGMTRWDSEPTELGQGTRFFSLNALEASWRTRQRQREMLEKNSQLENLRQNFEKWLKSKDQILLDPIVKEKETLIIRLRSEIESITEKIMEKELQITSLRDEMNNMRTIHIQEIASKEHLITQLHEEIYLLKSVKSHSDSSDQSLSPETKQSISHLKLQLRKAHSALEEMQGTQLMSVNVGTSHEEVTQKIKLEMEVEKLKEMLKTKEEEYVLLKSTSQIELDDAVKKFEEQRRRLEEQHKQELHDLITEYEEQIESIKNQKDDNNDEKEISQKVTSDATSVSDDTMPERLQLLLQQLNELGEHFLSISDFRFLQQYLSPHKQRIDISESFKKQDLKEFDETVEALRNLLTAVQNVNSQTAEESLDWRAEILMALGNVYMKEKDLIIAEINEVDSSCTELSLVNRLESKIQHLADIQESSMEVLMLADRKSLVSELNSVKRELSDTKLQLQNIKDDLGQQVSLAEENKSKLEWKLQRQIQMLECKLQQENVIEDDLKKTLKSERQRLSELTLQTTHDKSHLLELQSELSSTQIQLSKARDSLQREQQRFTSVTMGWSETLDALEEEKAKNVRLSELLDTTKKALDSLHEEVNENDMEYQRRRESEDNYVKELQEELLKERQRSYQFSQAEDEARRELAHEREQYKAALEKEKKFSVKLKDELEIIKSQLKRTENKSGQTDGDHHKISTNVRDSMERNVHVHLKVVEEDREKLRVKVNDLEHELSRIQAKMEELETELEKARIVTENFHHVEVQSDEQYLSGVEDNLEERLADCCLKLQTVAHKLDKMTLTSHQSKSASVQDQSTLVTVMSQLRQLRGEIKERGQNTVENASNSEQVNRLLEHNKQLACHIKQLKIEKKELVSSVQDIKSKIQDTKRAQVKLPQYLSDTASEDGVVYDRTVWASERLGLQMALDSAEHEIQRLRTEIQQFRTKIHTETSQADVDKTSRLYGKYLRAESFRKALIYQKKYLLLLLGGYRDTEQETLAILASMGGFAAPYRSSFRRNRSAAFTKFRSAGRVIIAISRMKYMVRRWKRATRVGSPVMAGQIPPHTSYVPSSSSYPVHGRHQFVSSDQLVSRNVHPSDTYGRSSEDYLLANGGVSTVTSRSHNHITTPPTKDLSPMHRQSKPTGKEKSRRDLFTGEHSSLSNRVYNGGGPDRQADDADDFLRYLQNIHKQLSEGDYGAGREVL
ncbi:hypothetical protein Btru_004500 [Bulinus truncatus]|nr:hypothetical protein Btru_004500 [Bulinus truncatus]